MRQPRTISYAFSLLHPRKPRAPSFAKMPAPRIAIPVMLDWTGGQSDLKDASELVNERKQRVARVRADDVPSRRSKATPMAVVGFERPHGTSGEPRPPRLLPARAALTPSKARP